MADGTIGPMKLYVMRHGPAGNRGDMPNDGERPLTGEGKQETRQAARGLKALKVKPRVILSSPLKRACQTAEIAAEELTGGKLQVVEALASGAAPADIVNALQLQTDDAMIVGHDPDFSVLISCLLAGIEKPFLDFSKSGVVALEFDGAPKPSGGVLLWYLRRGQLAQLGH